MNNKQFWLCLSLGLGFGTAFMFVAAPQAIAGNFSDVGGSILTTSDLAGGAFAPSGNRSRTRFNSSKIQAAVNQTAQDLNSRLGSDSLPVITPGASATNISPTVQNSLAQLINQSNGNGTNSNNVGGASRPDNVPNVSPANVNAIASQIETNLINGGANNPVAVRNLVSNLRGLTNDNRVNPSKLQSAIIAYNDLTKSGSDQYITNPPQEILAIDSILSYLVKASLTGQEVPIENNASPSAPLTTPQQEQQPPLVPVTPVQPSQPSPPLQPSQPSKPAQPPKPKPIIPQTW
jgi:hypothetical protein